MKETRLAFSQRGIYKCMEKMFIDCLHASCVNIFKNKIGSCLIKGVAHRVGRVFSRWACGPHVPSLLRCC